MAVNLAGYRLRPGTPRPHLITINIDGTRRTKSFPTKTAAVKYQTRLNTAVAAGDEFDPATGQPVAWAQAEVRDATACDIAQRIVRQKWNGLVATSRRGVVDYRSAPEQRAKMAAKLISGTSPQQTGTTAT